jgi:hypothetical protein
MRSIHEHLKNISAVSKFYGNPQTAHLALPQPHKPTLQAKPKESFFANALIKMLTL